MTASDLEEAERRLRERYRRTDQVPNNDDDDEDTETDVEEEAGNTTDNGTNNGAEQGGGNGIPDDGNDNTARGENGRQNSAANEQVEGDRVHEENDAESRAPIDPQVTINVYFAQYQYFYGHSKKVRNIRGKSLASWLSKRSEPGDWIYDV